jgi:hypothetical protein
VVGLVHNGGMAAADTTSINPPLDEQEADSVREKHMCACFADQEALSRQLAGHSDPHVRIIAHMSNRQLSMAEQLADLTRTIFRAAGGVSRVEEAVGELRVEVHGSTTAVDKLTSSVTELTKVITALSSAQSELIARVDKVEAAVFQGSAATTA